MRLLYPGSSNTGRRLIYPFGCKVAAYVCMRDESGFHRTTWGCSLATLPRRTARRVRASFLCHPLNFSHSSNNHTNHSKQYSHSIHTNRLAQHSSVHRRVCRVVEFLRAPGLQLSSTCKLRNVCPCRKNLFLEMSFFFGTPDVVHHCLLCSLSPQAVFLQKHTWKNVRLAWDRAAEASWHEGFRE